MEAVERGLRRGVGVAAIAHPLAVRTIDDVAAEAQVLEGPESRAVEIVEELVGTVEIGRAAVIGAHEPTADVGQFRLRVQPLDRNPPSHAVIEAIAECALAGGTKDEGACNPWVMRWSARSENWNSICLPAAARRSISTKPAKFTPMSTRYSPPGRCSTAIGWMTFSRRLGSTISAERVNRGENTLAGFQSASSRSAAHQLGNSRLASYFSPP